MIRQISNVQIFVSDQDRAKAFYSEKLGFKLTADAPLYPGSSNRWISFLPEGGTTELVLLGIDEQSSRFAPLIGTPQAVMFDVTNLMAYADELKAKGVQFTVEPNVQFWGTNAMILDSEGNGLMLVERPSAEPALPA